MPIGYLSTSEAAYLLKITPATIRSWAHRGKINRYRWGRQRVWSCDELAEVAEVPTRRVPRQLLDA